MKLYKMGICEIILVSKLVEYCILQTSCANMRACVRTCVCTYVCMYARTHTRMHVRAYVCAYARTYECMSAVFSILSDCQRKHLISTKVEFMNLFIYVCMNYQ